MRLLFATTNKHGGGGGGGVKRKNSSKPQQQQQKQVALSATKGAATTATTTTNTSGPCICRKEVVILYITIWLGIFGLGVMQLFLGDYIVVPNNDHHHTQTSRIMRHHEQQSRQKNQKNPKQNPKQQQQQQQQQHRHMDLQHHANIAHRKSQTSFMLSNLRQGKLPKQPQRRQQQQQQQQQQPEDNNEQTQNAAEIVEKANNNNNNSSKNRKNNGGQQQKQQQDQQQHQQQQVQQQQEATLISPILKAKKLYTFGRRDRSGSVITDMLHGHAFAFHHNVTYAGACYTPAQQKAHYPKRDVIRLLKQLGWTDMLPFACPDNINDTEWKTNSNKDGATALSPLILPREVYRDDDMGTYFTEAWRHSIQQTTNVVQQQQHDDDNDDSSNNKKMEDQQRQQQKTPFEIAVHIRRGDVTPCRYKRRYLTNDHYLQLIDQYTPKGDGDRPVHVTIFSEADTYEPFDVFVARNYTLELDTDDLAIVWKALSTADVVILSRSFFSFVPAAINPNTVVATPFFAFAPLPHWKKADDELVQRTDKQIRHIFDTECNATAIELERQQQMARLKHQPPPRVDGGGKTISR